MNFIPVFTILLYCMSFLTLVNSETLFLSTLPQPSTSIYREFIKLRNIRKIQLLNQQNADFQLAPNRFIDISEE